MAHHDIPRQADDLPLSPADQPENLLGRFHAQLLHVSAHGGQARRHIGAEQVIVAAHDADILRHADAVFLQRFHAADSA